MVTPLSRVARHLVVSRWAVSRAFPPAALERIEQAVAQAESSHGGQIRFAVEGALDPAPLYAGMSVRERAIQVFSLLRVWDTEQNNGVLIYVLLADRAVEIVADRGIDRHVQAAGWEPICQGMRKQFAAGNYLPGALEGIRQTGAVLARHFPGGAGGANELPDTPVIL